MEVIVCGPFIIILLAGRCCEAEICTILLRLKSAFAWHNFLGKSIFRFWPKTMNYNYTLHTLCTLLHYTQFLPSEACTLHLSEIVIISCFRFCTLNSFVKYFSSPERLGRPIFSHRALKWRLFPAPSTSQPSAVANALNEHNSTMIRSYISYNTQQQHKCRF